MLLAAGCVGPGPSPTDVSLSDNNVVTPSVRASFDLSGRETLAPSQAHSGHAIELAAGGANGRGKQTLGAGQQPIVFAGQTFNPPQQLDGDFHFKMLEAAWRWRRFFGDEPGGGAFGVELLAGGVYGDLNVALRSPTQGASQTLSGLGAEFGAGLIFRLAPQTSVQLRYTGFKFSDIDGGDRLDIHLAQALGRHAGVRAGYSTWDVKAKQPPSATMSNPFPGPVTVSPITVKFSGPFVALDVMF